MHNILGIVKVVIGEVFAVAVDGTQRQLHEGDRILAGEEIVTGANGALTVSLSDGHTMDMGRNSHWGEQSGLRAAVNSGHATDDVAALQQAIADGVDPTKALEATAAGNEAPIEAGTGGGGHFIEHVELTGKVLDVTSGFSTSSLDVRSLRGDEFTPLATQTSTSLNGTRITIDPIIAGEGNNTESLQPLEPTKPPQTDFPQPPHETDHNDVPAVDHPDRKPETSITINVVADDDIINAQESQQLTTNITGTVGGDAKAGDTVTLTVNGNTFTGTVEVQHDGSLGYRIPVTTTDLVSGQTVQATITTTDAAGNTASASADHMVSVDMGAEVGISVHPVTADGVINASESTEPTTAVTGTVSGDAKAGDT
ncbi:retention module-containing protein, partial [Buttiauxella warmboldiae]